MKNKLNRIISIILSSIITVTFFTACEKTDKNVTDMPNIVFVSFFYYPEKRVFNDGFFIGTSGYYIDKDGNIKYFELQNVIENIYVDSDIIRMKEYMDFRGIPTLHKIIEKNSIEAESETISTVSVEQLENYYNMLLNIDADGKLAYDFVGDKSSGIVIQSVSGIKCTYGVKYNSNGELEFVLLNENGNEYYINKNEKAEDLYQIINSIFQT